MKLIETMKSKKQVMAIAGIVIVAILLAFALGMVAFYSNHAGADDIGGGDNARSVIQEMPDGIELAAEEDLQTQTDGEDVGVPGTDESGAPGVVAQDAPDARRAATGSSHEQAGTNKSSSAAVSSSGSNAGASSSAPTKQKKWVEDTQQVWVEDKAAWSESVPVYGTKEVSVCNVCGADITGNTAAHSKAHMLAGEGSGHHSEVRRVITGYNSVSHPAEGHWETKVVGGHWE